MIEAKDLRIFGWVYKITNIINNKIYIGITRKPINKRWSEHKHNSIKKKKKAHINNAIYKYGTEKFRIDKLKTCYSPEQLYSSEVYFIKQHNSSNRNFGYNNSCGGEMSKLGATLSGEARKKISAYQKSRVRKPHTEETKEKLRTKGIGRDMSKAVNASANKRRGCKLSDKRRADMSLALKGVNSVPIIGIDKSGGCINFKSVITAAKELRILQSSISNALTQRAKTAGGFKWQYQNKI